MADRKITALTSLGAPAAGDLLPVIDISEAANVNKNKSITLESLFRTLGNGTAGAPAIGFLADVGLSGIYRPGVNEVGISCNSSFIGKFTPTGFQLGTGTADAQLHLFSADTTDQVVIENNDPGLDTAPDLVLYRNSASPASGDNLGNLEFRANDSGGNPHAYAQILAQISTATDASEDGILDLMSSASGVIASRIRIKGPYVGVGEVDPLFPLHLTTSLTGTGIRSECSANDSASGGDITMFHRRGVSGAGQDADILGTLFYRGKNDAATPEEIDYASVEGGIVDASDGTEDGSLKLAVRAAGTLTSQIEINGAAIALNGTTTFAADASINSLTIGRGAGNVATNTANGVNALYSNTTGSVNTAIGYQALYSNIDGSSNVANGLQTLYNNIDGSNNTANGRQALYNNIDGSNNVANGYRALFLNTTGASNTANGHQALYNNIDGSSNVANGLQALFSNTSGSGNIGIGYQALYNNIDGSSNVANGYRALYSNTSGSGNIGIGFMNNAGAYAPVFNPTTQNNRLVLGHTAITNAYVQVAWTVTSDERDKMNFAPVPYGLDFVNQLKPTAYQFKVDRDTEEPNGDVRYGFKAQDILALEGDNPVIIDTEDPDHLKYKGEHLVPVLVNAVQELTAMVKELQAEIGALKGT